METRDIAQRLAELCREGKFEQAQRELYADHAVSIEPKEWPGGPQTVEGLPNIIAKGDQFQNMVETYHGGYVSDPVVAGNFISLGLGMDITMKGQERQNMEEVCVYEVQGGKIVKEQFFY